MAKMEASSLFWPWLTKEWIRLVLIIRNNADFAKEKCQDLFQIFSISPILKKLQNSACKKEITKATVIKSNQVKNNFFK